MKAKVKKLVLLLLISSFAIGCFMNSGIFNSRMEEVYAEIKEEYSLSSDIYTYEEEEETVVESENTTEETEESGEDEEVAQAEESSVDNRTTEEKIWDYLTGTAGYTAIQTAAVIGNMYQESRLNPSAVESNGEGIGLVQWSFGRKAQLKAYATSKGTDWTDLETQLEFLVSEMKTNQFSSSYKKTFNNPYSVDEAVEAFCYGFERPATETANIAYRKSMAWAAYYRNIDR